MTDDVSKPETTALIVRPTVLPSLAQFEIMRQLAGRLFKARGFLPGHYMVGPEDERFAKVLAAIEYGRAVGVEPMIALQNLNNIDGKIGASALLIGAQLRKAGYDPATSWYDKEGNACPKESPNVWGCKVVISKNGRVTGDGVFSLTDAQRAGLLDKTNWKTYPKDMLYSRALTQAGREGAQDAILGMAYTAEELGADVDADGQVVSVPPPPGGVVDADFVEVPGQAPGVSEAKVSPPEAAIQPTPPAPSVEVSPPLASGGAGEQASGAGVSGEGAPSTAATQPQPDPATTPPPPQTGPVTPLGGPAFARRMGQGRSVGPAAKRTNVVTAEQGAEKPATAPQAPAAPVAQAEVIPGQQAPPDLVEEAVQAAPVDDGLGQQRELLRQAAAELYRVNTILRNKVDHALKNEPMEPVPPPTPNSTSDEGLARLIDRDYPGRTLANLDAAGLQNRLELVDGNLAKKRSQMLERGITED